MTTPNYIIALLTLFYLTSCRSTYRLSDTDYSWMPYKGNETLVFSSNTGETDTIFFLKKDTAIAYPEAQALNGRTYEVVSIFCRHSDAYPPDGKHRHLDNDFVQLGKSKDKKARLNFFLSAKDAKFYRLTGIRIDSLAKQPPTSLVTKTKTYKDVYVIESEDWLNFKQRSSYVTKLYWSKSHGLIRYDKQDGIFWELTNKYSP
jgi:hypothetical protein